MKALMTCALLLLATRFVALPAQADTSHPLEGRIWSVETAEFISRENLFDRLPKGGWLLLGEQHDHPGHHQLQAEWIERLAARDQLGAVALEMADHTQQAVLDQALGQGGSVTPEALAWQPGWPWALYQDVVITALNHAKVVAAADLTRAEQRQAYQKGAPEGELEAAHADFMRNLLYESHCGQIPRQALDGMRQLQLARDQHMARVLSRYVDSERTGVMLTGGIHARRDLGIPRWLKPPVVSVLMIPADGGTNPATYLPDGLPEHSVADYLLFTTTLPEKDYCAELEARHKD